MIFCEIFDLPRLNEWPKTARRLYVAWDSLYQSRLLLPLNLDILNLKPNCSPFGRRIGWIRWRASSTLSTLVRPWATSFPLLSYNNPPPLTSWSTSSSFNILLLFLRATTSNTNNSCLYINIQPSIQLQSCNSFRWSWASCSLHLPLPWYVSLSLSDFLIRNLLTTLTCRFVLVSSLPKSFQRDTLGARWVSRVPLTAMKSPTMVLLRFESPLHFSSVHTPCSPRLMDISL